MRRIRSLLLAALAAGLPAPALAQSAAAAPAAPAALPKPARLPADSLERARKYTVWLYTNQTDSLFAALDSAGRDQFKEPKGLEPSVTRLATRGGTEEQLLEERWVTRNGMRQYWRKARFSLMAEPLLIRWVILPSGAIGGLGMGPASQAPPIDP